MAVVSYTKRMTNTEIDLNAIETLGRQAYANGESAAPICNPTVHAIVSASDEKVGSDGPGIQAMRAFARGYEAEREAELKRLGF
jgi:hypothetical protein